MAGAAQQKAGETWEATKEAATGAQQQAGKLTVVSMQDM